MHIVLAMLLLAAAPTATTSPQPAETATITAPEGWGQFDFPQQMGPITTTVAYSATGSLSQHSDMIVLGSMALPAPGMDAATFGPQAAKALQAGFGATIKDSHAQKICNDTQAGWYISSQLTIDGSDMDVEETFAIGKTRAQMASYVREKDTAEITNARKSLDTLCLQ